MKKIVSIHNALTLFSDRQFYSHFTYMKKEFEDLFISIQSGNTTTIREKIKEIFQKIDKNKLESLGYKLVFNNQIVFSGKFLTESFLNNFEFVPKLIMIDFDKSYTLIR